MMRTYSGLYLFTYKFRTSQVSYIILFLLRFLPKTIQCCQFSWTNMIVDDLPKILNWIKILIMSGQCLNLDDFNFEKLFYRLSRIKMGPETGDFHRGVT